MIVGKCTYRVRFPNVPKWGGMWHHTSFPYNKTRTPTILGIHKTLKARTRGYKPKHISIVDGAWINLSTFNHPTEFHVTETLWASTFHEYSTTKEMLHHMVQLKQSIQHLHTHNFLPTYKALFVQVKPLHFKKHAEELEYFLIMMDEQESPRTT